MIDRLNTRMHLSHKHSKPKLVLLVGFWIREGLVEILRTNDMGNKCNFMSETLCLQLLGKGGKRQHMTELFKWQTCTTVQMFQVYIDIFVGHMLPIQNNH